MQIVRLAENVMLVIGIRCLNWATNSIHPKTSYSAQAANYGKYTRIRLAYDFALILFGPVKDDAYPLVRRLCRCTNLFEL
ncbi:hypothetical protein AGR8A_pTi20141 [Agrobacterium fabrum str. J-07]|nr:hypothetical protein AGR8A_pTi20141 [Agrobacterium fabrum str. J-07]